MNPALVFLLGGIQVHELDHWYWTTTVERTGLNTISATVYARQKDWDSADLTFKEEPAVLAEIREAKEAGLHVVLVLRVALDHWFPRNRYLWHGMIMPSTDAALDEWFDRYRAFAVEWARVAEREGIDVLAIGSEMNSLASTRPIDALPELEAYYLSKEKQAEYLSIVSRFADRIEPRHIRALGGSEMSTPAEFVLERAAIWEAWVRSTTFNASIPRINARAEKLDARWRDLIRAVRTEYRGKVTYAANFDQYQRVGFWDDLDLIGINAYFPLRNANEPATAEVLERGWTRVFGEIDRFRREAKLEDRRVLFTELGYTYRRGSTIEPWSQRGFSVVRKGDEWTVVLPGDEPQDNLERTLAVRALDRVQRALYPDLLGGLLYWKLSTIREHLAIEPFVMIIGDTDRDPLQDALTHVSSKKSL
jgi:hypothetical protein